MFYDYDEHVDVEDVAPVQPLENGGWICAFDSNWDELSEATAAAETRTEEIRAIENREYPNRISTYAIRQYRRRKKVEQQQDWLVRKEMSRKAQVDLEFLTTAETRRKARDALGLSAMLRAKHMMRVRMMKEPIPSLFPFGE